MDIRDKVMGNQPQDFLHKIAGIVPGFNGYMDRERRRDADKLLRTYLAHQYGAQRDRLNQQLQQILDSETEPWGIKVSSVEVKHVDLPQDMQRAMARQAEAEREKRAKIIHAEGELIASDKLAQAAGVIDKQPAAMTLRYLQTLTEIAAEQNSTIIFPLPIELMRMLRTEK